MRRLVELGRLGISSSPRDRWRAALSAFLLDNEARRGGDFRRAEADELLALFAKHMPEAVVVQIGANDGVTGDPLARWFAQTRWRGLLVEPVPFLCDALRRRYAGRAGVCVEQVAISDRDGEAPLYRVRKVPGETPEWFDQLATLDPDVLLKHRSSVSDIESLIIEERTPTARFETVLARHALQCIDLLVIDTEGHDYEILRQVDFARFQPLLLMFEHQHLSPPHKQSAYGLLSQNGYTYRETAEGDTIAWQSAF